MAESLSFICPYCTEDFLAPSEVLLLDHIRVVHSLDPNFTIRCNKDGCSRTFTNFRTYQNHRRTHVSTPPATNVHGDSLDIDTDPTSSISGHDTTVNAAMHAPSSHTPVPQLPTSAEMQSFAAKWILKTSETRSLTRTATIGIVEDVSELVDTVTQALKHQTQCTLAGRGVDQPTISSLDEVFASCVAKPFQGLLSFHQQLQYYRSHFNFVVSSSNISALIFTNARHCPQCLFIIMGQLFINTCEKGDF